MNSYNTFPVTMVQDAPTRMQFNKWALDSNQVLRISGGPIGRHRKQIVITNESNTNKMAIVEGDSVDPKTVTFKGLTIFVNESVTLFTNAPVTLKATDGAISEVQVLEIYYI